MPHSDRKVHIRLTPSGVHVSVAVTISYHSLVVAVASGLIAAIVLVASPSPDTRKTAIALLLMALELLLQSIWRDFES